MKKRTVLIFIFAAGFLLAEIPGNILYQSRRTLLETYDLIVGNYADSIDADNLMRSAIKGMTDELDPYTFYLRNDEKFNYQVLTSGHYGGVGMTITSHDDTISVVSVTAGSPISETDILPGDKLISIDGDT